MLHPLAAEVRHERNVDGFELIPLGPNQIVNEFAGSRLNTLISIDKP